MSTTAIFGAGVMGEALLSGLIRSGRDVADLTITEKRADHAAELNAKYGVSVLDNATAAKSADVLVLVVKPQDMDGLLGEIRDHVVPATSSSPSRLVSRPSTSSPGCRTGPRWSG